jgi:hypothetical protein
MKLEPERQPTLRMIVLRRRVRFVKQISIHPES